MNEKTQELALLLEEWLDNNGGGEEECRLDHNGWCQEHFDTPPCLPIRTREALGLDEG